MDLAAVAQQTTTAIATACGDDITAASKDPSNIVIKGKRTKRQRPAIVTNNSSTSYNAFNSNSPASSSEFPASSTTTEDEDTAKCLILLSKGHHQVSPRNNVDEFSGYKFNSKRYIQTSTEGLTGIYVYECKTCSRTFPSFQALGGHRASHKKPRINELDKRIKPPACSDEDEPSQLFPSKKNNSPSSSSLSLQLNHRVSSNYPGNMTKKSSSKLHECSICGAEFNSGQALGGHMRRHRAANTTTTTTSAAFTATNTTLSLIPYSPVAEYDEDHNQKSRNDGLYLDLDLNLPAPSESVSNQDQHRESTLKFTANQKKQQPAVHLSATPTLVDCHY